MHKIHIPTAKVFQPLLEEARWKASYGGRGSGKSHFFADLATEEGLTIPKYRLLCVREVQKSLKESAKRLIEDKVAERELENYFDCQTYETKIKGGGVITYVGMQDHTADSIKSFEGYHRAWIEEAHTISERSLELLKNTIRAPGSQIWASWNPRNATDPIDVMLRGANPPERSIVVKALYSDNPWFPSELEEERKWDEKNNRDRYGHIWLGDYEPQAIGAIWDRATIHGSRVSDIPDLKRIVVAVDPAVSAEKGSNEHGIVVVGLGHNNQGYVLDDVSMDGTPRQWADRAIAAYDRWEADAVVIEVNQGGDMCKTTLQAARPGLPVTEVRATRGKHVRAEPISALYHLGRVHHVGTFDQLEDQMCLMTAGGWEGKGSPDRLDALVWGLTHLFPQMSRKQSKPRKWDQADHQGWMS